MQTRSPNRYQTIAIIESSQAQAYRLKARLLGEGYRYVEVFLSRNAFREAVREGYTPDQVLSSDRSPAVV